MPFRRDWRPVAWPQREAKPSIPPTTSRPLAVPLVWFRATTRRFLKFKSNIHWPKVEVHLSIGFLSSWLASTKTLPLNQAEEGLRNLLRSVEDMYWELYCAYWSVETAKLGYESSLKVYRAAEARAKAGQTDQAVFWQAKAQTEQFEAQVNAALYGVNLPGGDIGVLGRERKLRMYLGLPPPIPITRSFVLSIAPPSLVRSSIGLASRVRRSIATLTSDRRSGWSSRKSLN